MLAGCVSSGTEVQPAQRQLLQKGVTTEAQVEKALGAPQAVSTAPNGQRVVVYSGVHWAAGAASYIPVVGLFAGSATAHATSVRFRFDRTAGSSTTRLRSPRRRRAGKGLGWDTDVPSLQPLSSSTSHISAGAGAVISGGVVA